MLNLLDLLMVKSIMIKRHIIIILSLPALAIPILIIIASLLV